jgi:hypothetical protein
MNKKLIANSKISFKKQQQQNPGFILSHLITSTKKKKKIIYLIYASRTLNYIKNIYFRN